MGFRYGGGKGKKKGLIGRAKDKLKSKSKKKPKSPWDGLKDIKGFGNKTVEDLKKSYGGSYKNLLKDIKEDKKIPIRDDLEEKLKEHLGGAD